MQTIAISASARTSIGLRLACDMLGLSYSEEKDWFGSRFRITGDDASLRALGAWARKTMEKLK